MRTLEELLKIFAKEGVTGYQLQRDLPISQVGADKILDGRTQSPHKNTISMLNEYVDNGFQPLESNAKQINESRVKYSSKKNLENFSDLEIIEYISDNLERFEGLSVFRKVVGLDEIIDLRLEVKEMRKQFLEIVHQKTK